MCTYSRVGQNNKLKKQLIKVIYPLNEAWALAVSTVDLVLMCPEVKEMRFIRQHELILGISTGYIHHVLYETEPRWVKGKNSIMIGNLEVSG